MKNGPAFFISFFLLGSLLIGCQNETSTAGPSHDRNTSSSNDGSLTITNQIVEASCGECQFEMEGDGCDLAVRIDGKTYYVNGSSIDDHGDAHGDDGICNAIRKAKVTGEIVGDRFEATSLEVLPAESAGD